MKQKITYRVFATFALLLICNISSFGQINRSAGVIKVEKIGDISRPLNDMSRPNKDIELSHPQQGKRKNYNIKHYTKSVSKSYNDTIYCTRTKKQHGWFMPMDTISKEFASHRSLSFRFTHKYPSGYWGKMETINGYGQLTTSNMSPYILKIGAAGSDKKAKKDWIEKLETSCIYEFIADPTGKTIIQERAYDKDRNLIYTYSRTPIGNQKFIGTYKDTNGLPAEMRNEPNYSYGTLVRLTEDKWGNDSIVEYIDSKGKAKPNSDGVPMEVYICDKYGHLLKQQSRNAKGELVKDNWGNCGIEYVWNDKNENIYTTYMDDNWKPMKMPELRKEVYNNAGTIKIFYQFDKYGREIKESFFTEDDIAEVNVDGIHQILYDYDNKGNLILLEYRDKDGNLKNDSTGLAIYRFFYDNQGRRLREEYINKDGKLRSNPSYPSTIVKEYDEGGNIVKEERYVAQDGIEHISYKKENRKKLIVEKWSDGIYRTDSLDAKGRILNIVFRDSLGNLSDKDFNYAIIQYNYVDLPKRTIVSEWYFDKNRKLCNPDETYAYEESIVDSVSNNTITKFYKRYDTEGNVTDTYMHEFTNDNLVRQYDTNAFGVICRVGGTSRVRYYKGDTTKSPSGNFSTIVAKDEFGEPDYVSSADEVYYYTKLSSKGKHIRLDENDNEISDNNDFMDKCPKLMSIEVTDSIAYRLGLKDNDVILLDGDYSADIFPSDSVYQTLTDFKTNWALHSVFGATQKRSMIVFRVNPNTKEYGLVKIDGLKGTPSELGYLTHIRYLTQKQLHRIQTCIKNNIKSTIPLIKESDFHKMNYSGNNYVILSYPDLYRTERNKPYAKQITDPSILLGSCIKDRNIKWTVDNEDDTGDLLKMLASRKIKVNNYPTQDYYLTRDGLSISHIILNKQILGTSWFNAYISDEYYDKLKGLYVNVSDSINHIMQENGNNLKQSIYGSWKTKDKSSKYDYTPEVHINFKKNGTIDGILINYGTIVFSEGMALFKFEQKLTGRWNYGNKWVCNEIIESDSTLTCIDLIGADNEELKDRALSFFNNSCKSNINIYFGSIQFNNGSISKDWIIESLSKNTLKVVSELSDTIELIRTKETPQIKFLAPKVTTEEPNDNIKAHKELINVYGYWRTKDIENPNNEIEICFKEDKTFDMIWKTLISEPEDSIQTYMIINFVGKWDNNYNSITLETDSKEINYDICVTSKSLSLKKKVDIERQMKEGLKSKIEDVRQAIEENRYMFGKDEKLIEIDSTKIKIGNQTFERCTSYKDIVLGTIEGDEGYLIKQGFTGNYVILKWCDWDCSQSIEDYQEEFEKQKHNEKVLVLLPVETFNGIDYFKDIITIQCPKDSLGIRLRDCKVSYNYYKQHIISRYKKHRMLKNTVPTK